MYTIIRLQKNSIPEKVDLPPSCKSLFIIRYLYQMKEGIIGTYYIYLLLASMTVMEITRTYEYNNRIMG